MVNLPDSLYEDYSKYKLTWPSASTSAPTTTNYSTRTTVVSLPNIQTILQWVNDLHSDILIISDLALQNLSIHRNNFEILPLLLWNTPFTIAKMLQEVVKIYRLPIFSQPGMPSRVYNILLLFQCIAHHPETRGQFLKAGMPHYFYPLMEISYTDKPLECVRLGALGVIAHMLKAPGNGAAIRFLMDTGAIRYCTKPVEIGSTESKTIAVFIINKIMSTDEGLQYCCVLADRFFVIDGLLKKLLVYLSSMAKPSPSLFNLVASCYFKLSQKARARDGIRRCLPVMLIDGTFASLLSEDPVADNYRKQLIENLKNKAMK
ncbi:CCR4-NOT transcription complex subunit 9 [Eutrema salsugineum]|uniref:CCR4-NOT transcription complex subunit 9 n=1 Tax=Eutrema salsugineum TaxID=72664 RepID=UPI000CED12A6|nr:CCR4-NOT transcription complex subunit 9 [Eutrema salsugineum]